MTDTTTNDDVRWTYLASAVTTILVCILAVLLIGASLGVLSLGAIPQAWFVLYGSAFLTSIVWTFGEDAYKRWKGGE